MITKQHAFTVITIVMIYPILAVFKLLNMREISCLQLFRLDYIIVKWLGEVEDSIGVSWDSLMKINGGIWVVD
jgi:hypothetical protein